jgi:hypothetical protein
MPIGDVGRSRARETRSCQEAAAEYFMSKSYIWGNPPENKTRSNKTHAGLFPAHSTNRNPTTMRGLIALLAVIALSCFSQTDAQLANPGATGAAAKEGGLGGGLRCDQANLACPDR